MANKSIVAGLNEYPKTPSGYYALAFKKTLKEKVEIKEAKREHKAAIARDYPEYTPAQRKRILNPKN